MAELLDSFDFEAFLARGPEGPDKVSKSTLGDKSQKLSYSEMSKTPQSTTPKIAAAEVECEAGDVTRASASIDDILRDGTHVKYLSSCLRSATRSGSVPLVEKLLSLGVPFSCGTPHPAIQQGSLELLKLFLKHGWDINGKANLHYPPSLALAFDPGTKVDEKIVSWFLDNGADPHEGCCIDTTPFSIALRYAPLPIIEKLFARSGAPRHGQPLHHAAERTLEDCDKVVRLVLERCPGVQVNQILFKNHAFSFVLYQCVGLGTALHGVAKSGKPQAARVLLKHGADTTILDTDGKTALEKAEESGNHSVAAVIRQVSMSRL